MTDGCRENLSRGGRGGRDRWWLSIIQSSSVSLLFSSLFLFSLFFASSLFSFFSLFSLCFVFSCRFFSFFGSNLCPDLDAREEVGSLLCYNSSYRRDVRGYYNKVRVGATFFLLMLWFGRGAVYIDGESKRE